VTDPTKQSQGGHARLVAEQGARVRVRLSKDEQYLEVRSQSKRGKRGTLYQWCIIRAIRVQGLRSALRSDFETRLLNSM